MRVHQVFVSLGLRHLCVVDAWNRAVGIVTRKDLDKAAGSGSWRRNPVFASQDRCAGSTRLGSCAAGLAVLHCDSLWACTVLWLA
jgi:CBS-domain-containing membrane protein